MTTMENKIKIALAGNVDSGKSSLIGVLTTNWLDDGRGFARQKVTNLKHELESGRTSAISYSYVRFAVDEEGQAYTVNQEKSHRCPTDLAVKPTYRDGAQDVSKIITLVDLAGHEKYFKTTIRGLTGLHLDYAIVLVGANMGVTRMTKEHLGVLLHLKIPFIVVITKIDICPPNIYTQTKKKLKQILKIPAFKRTPVFLEAGDQVMDEIHQYTQLMQHSAQVIPVVSVSNTTGENLSVLTNLLYNLTPRQLWNPPTESDGSIMYVDATFNVRGIGLVLSGTVRGQDFTLNQNAWIGPYNGRFIPIRIRSMHNNLRENIETLSDGQTGCIAVKFINKEILTRDQVKRGMIVVSDQRYAQNVCWTFKARVTVLHHSTTIANDYQPVVHCGTVSQSATIRLLEDEKPCLRTNDNSIVQFTFKYWPEYMEEGTVFFFRDGRTKGIGEVVEVIPAQ